MKKITNISDITSAENFEETAVALYGDASGQLRRYADLYVTHEVNYKGATVGWFFSSPGRIEVVGNHTDHNNGKVLAAAVTVDTLAFVTPSDDGVISISSEGFEKVECAVSDLTPVESEKGTSVALVKGVLKYFVDNEYNVGGFKASTVSNVPKGAGVSSSAAFEVLVAEILNFIYNGDKIMGIKKALASQYAENAFFGKPCGLMDQSAIALGGVSMIDFKNPENPEVINVAWPFNQLDIVVTNTGGNHVDLTDHYASIRYEMEQVAEYFGVEKLRDVDYNKFLSSIPELQQKVSGRAILRAVHFFDENNRVERAVSALQYSNLDGFVKTIVESGVSSFTLLQNCYVPGETDERIPMALTLSKRFDGVKAVRIHGGGFAGTVIAYVEKSATNTYMERMRSIFGDENVYKLGIRRCGACKVKVEDND